MPLVNRVLDRGPIERLDDYIAAGGGAGLAHAREIGSGAIIAAITDARVRGRGGAGFPTGRKWRTVTDNASQLAAATVVVNAAEGEPGSFKDRELLRRNPYRILEGALIAAVAVGADTVIVGMKGSFTAEIARVRRAIEELRAVGWGADTMMRVHEGPAEYLLGEETALLETIDGREPFPRIAPPYRRGVDEVVEHADDLDTESGSAAHVEMAGPSEESSAPPTLVDNVETLAHVALVLANGVDWFRALGTASSPGTLVCTVSGAVQHAGVGEVEMGTPLRDAIDQIGGGVANGRVVKAVLQGVSAGVLGADDLDVPLSWEGMADTGSGLGAAAFIVFDDTADMVAVAAGASRFLAVESCGQCTPCKLDGLAIADALDAIRRSEAAPEDFATVEDRLATVADGARCSLAAQHQAVVGSLVERFAGEFEAHVDLQVPGADVFVIAPLLDLTDGAATVDVEQLRKQPDWSFDESWSGANPADALDDHRAHEHRGAAGS